METQTSSKILIKNSLFLYFRMFFTMLVSVYTSRVILQILGIEDYGLYNVVGGVIVMFSFMNMSMTTATSRYLNYELGLKTSSLDSLNDINKVANHILHIFIR